MKKARRGCIRRRRRAVSPGGRRLPKHTAFSSYEKVHNRYARRSLLDIVGIDQGGKPVPREPHYCLRLNATEKLEWDSMSIARGMTTSAFIRESVRAKITAEVGAASAELLNRTAPIIAELIATHGRYVSTYDPRQMSNVSLGGSAKVADWIRLGDPKQTSDDQLRDLLRDLLEAMTEPLIPA